MFKQLISPWIITISFIVKKSLLTFLKDKNRLELIKNKSVNDYYVFERGPFIWFQIFMVWLSLYYSIIDSNFITFIVIFSLWSFITILRTIEYYDSEIIS
jgi:hypothetical protein